MRILVTNDDGINADGLAVAADIARALSDDVWIVAPETNQSGTSHSLTLHTPLRVRQIDERTFAIGGTPTDCVIMGVRHILKEKRPDLILSGVNDGSNVAEDVTYSGTVAGAMEGTILGIPSVALSLMTRGLTPHPVHHWDTPRTLAPDLISRLLRVGWPAGSLLNINFPALPAGDVRGMRVTRQGIRDQDSLVVDQRADPWGKPYYWFGFRHRPQTLVEGTDLSALAEGAISVTPLSLDLTDDAVAARLATALAPVASKAARG